MVCQVPSQEIESSQHNHHQETLTGAEEDGDDRQAELAVSCSWRAARPGGRERGLRGGSSVPTPRLPEQDSNIEIDLLVDS